MGKLRGFLEYLEEQVKNHSIYIWGAQGQAWPTVCEKWIKEKESGQHEKDALATYKKAVAAGYKEKLRAFDCSGLGMYYLYNKTRTFSGDLNANGMKGKCKTIERAALKKGDWVFRVYKTGAKKGRAYHIGYVVDDKLNVIEARGRAYGVVKRKLNASGAGYWNAYGRPEIFRKEIEGDTPVFKRELKRGMSGKDVSELKKLLIAAGFLKKSTNDKFASGTKKAVKLAQTEYRLKQDGIAGEKTITALGGIFEK